MSHPSVSYRSRSVFAILIATTVAGCAHGIPEVDPGDIPRIQREIGARPSDTDLQVQLGMAQHKAGDYEQAVTTLQAAIEAGNQTGAAYLYLGMSHEEVEDWESAREAYSTYLDVGPEGQVQDELRKRLQLMAQNVLREQARQALAQEDQISSAPPTPRSIAVLPFGFNSPQEELEPLVYALSDMMITDFAVSNALTVLERTRIQTLIDEIALQEAGLTEAVGARAGRMLRAENVVQGVLTTLGQESLRLDEDVLNTQSAGSIGTVTNEDQLNNLFDMEKDLVFRTLRDVLGVELTPAEEQRIRDNRAANLQAFLAYGRGLRARDQGDFATAEQEFQQALGFDPAYQPAATALDGVRDLADAVATTTGTLGQTASNTGVVGGGAGALGPPPPPPPPSLTLGSTATTLGVVSEGVNPTPTTTTLDLGTGTTATQSPVETQQKREPVQEAQGQESVARTPRAQIRIVIRRPGGEQ